ncbi:MAG: spermidine synthase [Pseudomonadota bacterium]
MEQASTGRTSPAALWGLIALFTVSGFSGLIYESIWTQYLKLWLGHAAYAQSLVLTIFMGGMALGAWWVGQRTTRFKNLLIGYAVVEGIIGLAGLGFHGMFTGSVGFAQSTVFPALGDSTWVDVLKWTFAATLILPQSVLLGMTFPFMSGALLRRYPDTPGHGIAALYFSNSLGAAVGVLASGYVLIPAAGLPGTVLTAGSINVVLALVVYLWAKTPGWTDLEPAAPVPAGDAIGAGPVRLLLLVALLTGTASFIYEIAWIRMLSMVLGSSTHAFELMLSAFILGLALGSLWIRGRIERLGNPLGFLGGVQLVMGVLAIGTILTYHETFVWMAELMRGLGQNDAGYALYNAVSQGIAIAVMLPVTICAGMTLPLITFLLLKGGVGERSIGHVYAANTVGAIVGVLFAIHIGLPALGLADTIVFGAAIDIIIGLVLVVRARGRSPAVIGCGVVMAAVLASGLSLELDAKRMASSVFRYGKLGQLEKATVPFAGDGKTATIHIVDYGEGLHGILTNGKTDSSLQVDPDKYSSRSLDEYNMSLLPALPLAAHRSARRVAVIGFGAGLSTHVALGDPNLEVVDSIEIEPRMIEAARLFAGRVGRAYDDPRSVFRFEDARTFFATHQQLYDVIASEPSTPWVSGVASLYTEEFYRQVRNNLTENGIFAQWLHGSELSMDLTALVGRTLGRVFDDYLVFNLNGHDAVFIASKNGPVDLDPAWPFGVQPLSGDLAAVNLTSARDVAIRYLGNKAVLDPWFQTYGTSVNSDYFPLLDLNAVEARFKRQFAARFYNLRTLSVPIVEMLGPDWAADRLQPVNTEQEFGYAAQLRSVDGYVDALTGAGSIPEIPGSEPWRERLGADRLAARGCGATDVAVPWWNAVNFMTTNVLPATGPDRGRQLVQWLAAQCASLDQRQQHWLALMDALATRDAAMMVTHGKRWLEGDGQEHLVRKNVALSAALLGLLIADQAEAALGLWQEHGGETLISPELDLLSPLVKRKAGR